MRIIVSERREYRSRPRRRRGEPEIDAIAVALTVQIILCVILLVAAGIAKRANEEGYDEFRQEFMGLMSADAEGERLAAYFRELGDLGQGFFSSVENLLQSVFRPNAPVAEASVPQEEESAAEDLEHSFNYGYLEGQGVAAAHIPYALSANLTRQLEAPPGNTLAPVYLAGSARPPVAGPITSPFAYRLHPISGEADFHNGIDIAAEEGRGILAALSGEVEETGWSDIYGNYIILRHATNLKTFYAHCSQLIAREGMKVRQGERIARVGSTGTVTGSHLHFSVIAEEQYADPYWILADYLELVE